MPCPTTAAAVRFQAASVARDLIRQGADVNAVCGWTHMTPLHYAAFFGSTSVLQVLATEGRNLDINAPCSELEGATPLHMAAMTGSPGAVETLLKHGELLTNGVQCPCHHWPARAGTPLALIRSSLVSCTVADTQ
jgi:ankyrin repeat protein